MNDTAITSSLLMTSNGPAFVIRFTAGAEVSETVAKLNERINRSVENLIAIVLGEASDAYVAHALELILKSDKVEACYLAEPSVLTVTRNAWTKIGGFSATEPSNLFSDVIDRCNAIRLFGSYKFDRPITLKAKNPAKSASNSAIEVQSSQQRLNLLLHNSVLHIQQNQIVTKSTTHE